MTTSAKELEDNANMIQIPAMGEFHQHYSVYLGYQEIATWPVAFK